MKVENVLRTRQSLCQHYICVVTDSESLLLLTRILFSHPEECLLLSSLPPHSMNSNSRESLNGAQRASGYQVSVAGVTAGDGNTHDFRAAVERP